MSMTVQAVKQGECEVCLIVLALDTQEQTTENKQTNKQQKTLQGLNKDGTNCLQSLPCKTGQVLKIKLITIYSSVIFS